jgi:hypothetical protein
MEGFKFKGIPLSTVIDTGTTTASGYTVDSTSLKYATTPFANSRPLPTGYLVNGVDLSNTARADNIAFNTTTSSQSVPTGAKSCRYILRGGGGGCGGGGGAAGNKDGPSWYTYGAHAQGGAQGDSIEGNVSINSTTYKVTIGSGGSGGNGGGGSVSDKPNANYKAPNGKKGNSGGSTYITFASNTPVAAGGAGGNGGKGGIAPGNDSHSGYTMPGTRKGSHYGATVKGHTSWDTTYVENTGLGAAMIANNTGGTGGNISGKTAKSGSKGDSGSSGSAHIIWLYE